MASLSSLFGNAATPAKKLCQFELRLDESFVVLKGSEDETSSFNISGRLVLMNSETIHTKGISVTLEGKRRTMRFLLSEKDKQSGPPAKSPIVNKATFLKKSVKVLDGARTIKPGNHEWRFDFAIEGNTPESIEGLPGNYVTYSMNALADRGLLAKDLTAQKHLRIIRTLSDDTGELGNPQVSFAQDIARIGPAEVNGFWPGKLKYQFTTKSRAAIFGDKIVTDIEFTPLVEKLRIGQITIALKEQRKIRTIPGPEFDPSAGWHGMWKEEHEVAKTSIKIPEGAEDTDTELQLPMFRLKSTLALPKSLRECRQTVERNDWIRIKHTVHYNVLLHNADGHVSELRAHHGVRLFISAHLPVDENNRVTSNSTVLPTGQNTLIDELQSAPPAYATHKLDRLYEDIDPSGFMTPGTRNISRRPSVEQIDTRNTQSQRDLAMSHSQALSRRLMNLELADDSSSSSSRDIAQGNVLLDSSNTTTEPSSRDSFERNHVGTSHEHVALDQPALLGFGQGHGSQHVDFDMGALERMPSYGTAIRTPVRATMEPRPPTYEIATSRPASPH